MFNFFGFGSKPKSAPIQEEKKYPDEFERDYLWICDAREIEDKEFHEYDDVTKYSKIAIQAKDIYIENNNHNIRYSLKRRDLKDMAYKIYQENKDKSFKEKLLYYVDAKNFFKKSVPKVCPQA